MNRFRKLIENINFIKKALVPLAVVAPLMGSLKDGVEFFQSLKPPYARGGGTPATRFLEEQALKHIGKWDSSSNNQDAPYVSTACSGQAANHQVFKALRGGNLVSSKHLFGTTKVDLAQTFEDEGGHISWVDDPSNVQAFIDATTPETTAWFVEAISNPAGRVPDLKKLHQEAQKRGIALIVDATLAAGMPNFKGIEHADILTASLTKQAGGGKNENIGGIVIVNNKFDWHGLAKNFPKLEKYFWDKEEKKLKLPANPFGAMVTKIGLHEGSGAIAPKVAKSIGKLLPSMEKRVKKMCENAKMLGEFLQGHDKVENVQLAGAWTDAVNDQQTKQDLGENHFVLLVKLKDGFNAASQFINSDEFDHAVALGQRRTAVSHPASSTHRQYNEEQLSLMGIFDGTIRISVGCEQPRQLKRKISKILTSLETVRPQMT